jgi:hypothetical protein
MKNRDSASIRSCRCCDVLGSSMKTVLFLTMVPVQVAQPNTDEARLTDLNHGADRYLASYDFNKAEPLLEQVLEIATRVSCADQSAAHVRLYDLSIEFANLAVSVVATLNCHTRSKPSDPPGRKTDARVWPPSQSSSSLPPASLIALNGGVIETLAMISADGTVEVLATCNELPFGLTASAIEHRGSVLICRTEHRSHNSAVVSSGGRNPGRVLHAVQNTRMVVPTQKSAAALWVPESDRPTRWPSQPIAESHPGHCPKRLPACSRALSTPATLAPPLRTTGLQHSNRDDFGPNHGLDPSFAFRIMPRTCFTW